MSCPFIIGWRCGPVRAGPSAGGSISGVRRGRCRPNTLRAVAFDLKTFFEVVAKDPVEVVAADVFEFLADQRGDRTVIRMSDRESGLSARTITRRLSSVSGFYVLRGRAGDTPLSANPVPRGLSTRRQGGSRRSRTVPLVRVPRTLPKILSPVEVNAAAGRAAHASRPSDGLGDGVGRPTPLRGARLAVGGSCGRGTSGVRRGGQGRSSAGGADRGSVLRRGRLTISMTNDPEHGNRSGVRRVEGSSARSTTRPPTGLDEILAGARRRAGLRVGPVTSCGTRA